MGNGPAEQNARDGIRKEVAAEGSVPVSPVAITACPSDGDAEPISRYEFRRRRRSVIDNPPTVLRQQAAVCFPISTSNGELR